MQKNIILFGSELCPSCGPVKEVLEKRKVRFTYTDVMADTQSLQQFLKIRDTSPAFEDFRGGDKIGIPCLQVDNAEYILYGAEFTDELIDELGLV